MTRLVRLILLLPLLALWPPLATPARAEVRVWEHQGIWQIPKTPLEGKHSDGSPITDVALIATNIAFTYLGQSDAVTAFYFAGNLQGIVSGKLGLRMKGTVIDPLLGDGTFTFTMADTLDRFTGVMKLKKTLPSGRVRKGKLRISATFVPYSQHPDTMQSDVYDLGIGLEFAAAKSGKPLEPGKKAVLVAFLVNRGPNPLPLGIYELRIVFGPQPVPILNVIEKQGVGDLGDFEVPDGQLSPIRVPLVLKDGAVIAVKFEVPESLAGQTLTADARIIPVIDLNDASQDDTAQHAEIRVRDPNEVTVKFTLQNFDASFPIHIFQVGTPNPCNPDTRVPAGGKRTLKVSALPGTFLSFAAGREKSPGSSECVIYDTCGGTIVQAGSAKVTWLPMFGDLFCG